METMIFIIYIYSSPFLNISDIFWWKIPALFFPTQPTRGRRRNSQRQDFCLPAARSNSRTCPTAWPRPPRSPPWDGSRRLVMLGRLMILRLILFRMYIYIFGHISYIYIYTYIYIYVYIYICICEYILLLEAHRSSEVLRPGMNSERKP